jgi:hypothetical protein
MPAGPHLRREPTAGARPRCGDGVTTPRHDMRDPCLHLAVAEDGGNSPTIVAVGSVCQWWPRCREGKQERARGARARRRSGVHSLRRVSGCPGQVTSEAATSLPDAGPGKRWP